jgi:hypothetical protein
MTKERFLEELREALENVRISDSTIKDTLKEYEAMIDDALDAGETIDVFIKRMGSPKKVARALARDYPHKDNKFVALMPFFSTILFFIFGVIFNAWHPGWLIFLSIPIAGILSSKRVSWVGLLVFVSLIIFILAGTYLNAWHPGWLIFLSIPLAGILSNKKVSWVGFSLFVTVIIFVLGGTYFNLWNPLWSLFLFIIPLGNNARTKRLRPYAIAYTWVAIAFYHALVIGITEGYIGGGSGVNLTTLLSLPILLFVPVFAYTLFNGAIQINFRFNGDKEKFRREMVRDLFLISLVIGGYLLLGLLGELWHPGWLIFFFVPIFFIVTNARRLPIVSLMPFIATILFVLVGEYVTFPNQDSGYALSWLFFLLIPMSGILFKERG